jgi:hypothetical protein
MKIQDCMFYFHLVCTYIFQETPTYEWLVIYVTVAVCLQLCFFFVNDQLHDST